MIGRRSFLLAASAVAALAARSATVVRLMLGFPAGASGDAIARALAQKMGPLLDATVIVDDRPGAGGRLVLDQVKRADADGTTIVLTPLTPLTSAPWLYPLSYDPFKDFTPIAHIAAFKYVLVVSPHFKADTLAAYLELARHDAKARFYSAPSPGGAAHMAMADLGERRNLDFTFVPYKGTASALNDLLGGELGAFMANVADVVELAHAQRLQPIAVASATRSRHLPNVPTFKEQGIDIEAAGGFGIYAPAGLAGPAAARLQQAVLGALRDPAVSALADKLGLEVTGYGPAQLVQIQRADYEQTGRLIKASGFKIES